MKLIMLCVNNNRIKGEELMPVKCILASHCLRLLSVFKVFVLLFITFVAPNVCQLQAKVCAQITG